MKNTEYKKMKRARRHARVRAKVSGTASRPRLSVFRSNRYIYAQIIDDVAKKTLVSASDLKLDVSGKTKKERAYEVGKEVARRAKEKGIESVVFDRGGYLYTGRVKALAEGAREGGLRF